MVVTPGRPRAASPQLLEDAATELFIENGYAATTVDAIAQRAGVSRNTFFNYFGAKSDVLWFGADQAIEALKAECATGPTSDSPLHCARNSTLSVARSIGDDRVPLALTQLDVMGAKDEIEQSGMARVGRLAEVYRQCLVGARPAADATTTIAVASSTLAACAAAAWASWARAGTSRAPLVDYVDEAFAVVFLGFESVQL